VYSAVPAARCRALRRIVAVCWRWAWATAFCARRAAAGEEPVGSVAAMAAARGVVAAVWMASKAAWWVLMSLVGVKVGIQALGGWTMGSS
jgi:hypothetical protein